jgi:hypothetical protein
MMRRLNIIQLDSVPVIIRTQYMPGFSRLGPYEPELFDHIAYRKDEWFEAFVHEASLVPVEDEPLFRFMKARSLAGGTWGGLVELAKCDEAQKFPVSLSNCRQRASPEWDLVVCDEIEVVERAEGSAIRYLKAVYPGVEEGTATFRFCDFWSLNNGVYLES